MTKESQGPLLGPLVAAAPGSPPAQRELVYATVHRAIAERSLAPGARLPSSRRLAADWQVARGAVDAAFDQLHQEGLVHRRVGDGTYVADPLPAGVCAPSAPPLHRPLSRSAQQVLERFAPYMGRASKLDLMREAMQPRPLFPRAPFIDSFPLHTWRSLMNQAFAESQRGLLSYGAASGLQVLREAIARHLTMTRATPCSAAQVMVVNGPLQGLELISRVLLEPGDEVWHEDPGYGSVPPLFTVLHQRPVPVPVDAQGLDVATGLQRAPNAAAVYLHPLVQFPTGWRTSVPRRRALIDWADRSGAWIVEGNFNDELAHDRHAPPPMSALDRSERVLTMGTFEGLMFPSLRVAYLVVPERLLPVFSAMRGLMGDHTSVSTQLALARFIDEGHLARRLRGLREHLATQREVLRAALARHLPPWAANVTCGPLDGDGHACLHLPPALNDRAVTLRWRELGVSSFALSSTCVQPRAPLPLNGLAFAYAPYAAADIERAVALLAQALAELQAAGESVQIQPSTGCIAAGSP